MGKTLFKDANGNIHFGTSAPDGFRPCGKDDAIKSLAKLGKRKLWRCNVCNDVHLNLKPPKICPTCITPDAYVEISDREFRMVAGV